MHGDSYPCCRQSIRLCLPAYPSKALTDIKIAAELLRALRDDGGPALVAPERKLDGFKSRVSFWPITGGMAAVLVWVSTAPGRVTLFCNRSRR